LNYRVVAGTIVAVFDTSRDPGDIGKWVGSVDTVVGRAIPAYDETLLDGPGLPLGHRLESREKAKCWVI
jgi:hypothetical protein